MKSRIMKKSVLIFIIGLLILPSFAFAELNPQEIIKNQDKIELKKSDTKEILKSLTKNELTERWIDSSVPKEQVILLLLSKGIKINALNYLLFDVSGKALKSTLELAYLLLSKDPSLYIEKFEESTVNMAKEYAMGWLLQNEIKVGKGNLKDFYHTYDGGGESITWPYIIVYKPINSEQANVVIEIYSSKQVKTPDPRGDYIYGNEWEGGLKEIPPFTVRIKGKVEKYSWISYKWTEGLEIDIIFDEEVPSFDFKEPSMWDEIASSFNKVKDLAKDMLGDTVKAGIDGVEVVVEGIKNFWDTIKVFVSGSSPLGASISETIPTDSKTIPEYSQKVIEESIEKGITMIQESFPALERTTEEGTGGPEMNEEEIQEILDDISEKIDVLVQQVSILMPKPLLEEPKEELLEEEPEEIVEEEVEEETEEETEEELVEENNVEEIVTARSTTGGSSSVPPPSYCSLVDLGSPVKDQVIFDEIGWMGTDVSPNDEWIKLRNITGNQVDLSGWQVIDKDKQIKVILNGGIDNIYLMERTDDSSVPDVPADIIYTGALNNNDEIVYLFNNNCELQDITESPLPAESFDPAPEDEPEPEPEPEPEIEEPVESSDPAPKEEPSKKVIFNEVAWAGTRASANDEWIELYNPSDEMINLSDWQLVFTPIGGDPRITNISPTETTTPTINIFSYFLLERTNDNSISDIEADYIFTGALNDEGGVLELRDSNNNLVDKLDFSEGWLAGDKEGKVSMERYGDGWTNNNLIIQNGKDADDNNIWGTPRAENSINSPTTIWQLPFNYFDEITLGIESSSYIIANNLDVPEGKTLIIDPGVVLKFNHKERKITVEGTLKAIGTDDDKITFTCLRDDPSPGCWGGVHFTETSVDSELDNTIFRYAGGAELTGKLAVQADNTSLIIQNSLFEYNMYKAINLINSDSLIDNVQFIENATHCPECHNVFISIGVSVSGGSPTIQNCLFEKNGYGVKIENNSTALIKDNIFKENKYVAWLNDSQSSFIGNEAVDNNFDGILTGGNISQDTTWSNNFPYIIYMDINVFPDITLILDPGVILKFNQGHLKIAVEGTLKAIGTEDDKITFTCLRDDPYPGCWAGAHFTETSLDSELDNTIFEYAGYEWNNSTAVCVENSLVTIKDSLFRYNKNKGIYLVNSDSLIDNVQFTENVTYCEECHNKSISVGVYVSGGSPTIQNSLFKKNGYGIRIQDDGDPSLVDLVFGIGDEANVCNIYKENKCIDPLP